MCKFYLEISKLKSFILKDQITVFRVINANCTNRSQTKILAMCSTAWCLLWPLNWNCSSLYGIQRVALEWVDQLGFSFFIPSLSLKIRSFFLNRLIYKSKNCTSSRRPSARWSWTSATALSFGRTRDRTRFATFRAWVDRRPDASGHSGSHPAQWNRRSGKKTIKLA